LAYYEGAIGQPRQTTSLCNTLRGRIRTQGIATEVRRTNHLAISHNNSTNKISID
jgi:hypothetical protein